MTGRPARAKTSIYEWDMYVFCAPAAIIATLPEYTEAQLSDMWVVDTNKSARRTLAICRALYKKNFFVEGVSV